MKYLKYFEKDTNIAKFKPGDIVYCINTEVTTSLYKDEKYKVLNIDDEYIKINNGTNNRYWKYRFISELEYNANKYNIG